MPTRERNRAALARRAAKRAPTRLNADMIYVSPLIQLVIVPGRTPGLVGVDRQGALDAANECGHGRLSGDRSVPCGCWPLERLPASLWLVACVVRYEAGMRAWRML